MDEPARFYFAERRGDRRPAHAANIVAAGFEPEVGEHHDGEDTGVAILQAPQQRRDRLTIEALADETRPQRRARAVAPVPRREADVQQRQSRPGPALSLRSAERLVRL